MIEPEIEKIVTPTFQITKNGSWNACMGRIFSIKMPPFSISGQNFLIRKRTFTYTFNTV